MTAINTANSGPDGRESAPLLPATAPRSNQCVSCKRSIFACMEWSLKIPVLRILAGLPTGLTSSISSVWSILSALGFSYCMKEPEAGKDDPDYDKLFYSVISMIFIFFTCFPVLYEQIRKVTKYPAYTFFGKDFWGKSPAWLKTYNGTMSALSTGLTGWGFFMLFAEFIRSESFPKNARTMECYRDGWNISPVQIILGVFGIIFAYIFGGLQMKSFYGHQPPHWGNKRQAMLYSIFKLVNTAFSIIQKTIKHPTTHTSKTNMISEYTLQALAGAMLTWCRYRVYFRSNKIFTEEARLMSDIETKIKKFFKTEAANNVDLETQQQLSLKIKKLYIEMRLENVTGQKVYSQVMSIVFSLLGAVSSGYLNFHSMDAIASQVPSIYPSEAQKSNVQSIIIVNSTLYAIGRFFRFYNAVQGSASRADNIGKRVAQLIAEIKDALKSQSRAFDITELGKELDNAVKFLQDTRTDSLA